jgi:hypothetical protein
MNTQKQHVKPDGTMEKDHRIAVFGLFDDRVRVENAIDALLGAGFRNSDISAVLPDMGSTRDLAHEKHTKAPEGAAVGAATGGVVGGAVGLLAGLGAIAIPGLGALVAIGPIMGFLAGAGAGGAVGTLTGTLIGLGIPEYEAKRYESFMNQGKCLVAVHADDREWAKRARSILDNAGAFDVDQKSEATAKKPPSA